MNKLIYLRIYRHILFCFNNFTYKYFWNISANVIFHVPVVPEVLIAVGFASSVTAFLGCCGAIMKNPCMLLSVRKLTLVRLDLYTYIYIFCLFPLQFSIVIFILLIAQFGFGSYGLINYDQLIEDGLTETLRASKDRIGVQKAWAALQFDVSFYLPILNNVSLNYNCNLFAVQMLRCKSTSWLWTDIWIWQKFTVDMLPKELVSTIEEGHHTMYN